MTKTTTRIKYRPLIILPPGTITGIEPFVDEAANLDSSTHYDVPTYSETLGTTTVVANGACDWHSDGWMGIEYSALLVIRNDADSWVETRERKKYRQQPIGTLVLLDILREHRLTCRHPAKHAGLWMAIVIDYPGVPKPDDCIRDMKWKIRRAREEQGLS